MNINVISNYDGPVLHISVGYNDTDGITFNLDTFRYCRRPLNRNIIELVQHQGNNYGIHDCKTIAVFEGAIADAVEAELLANGFKDYDTLRDTRIAEIIDAGGLKDYPYNEGDILELETEQEFFDLADENPAAWQRAWCRYEEDKHRGDWEDYSPEEGHFPPPHFHACQKYIFTGGEWLSVDMIKGFMCDEEYIDASQVKQGKQDKYKAWQQKLIAQINNAEEVYSSHLISEGE